jgi:methyltransferase-like protein
VRFVVEDVRSFEPGDTAASDYIIAHGLYSWVPEDARAAILAFFRRNLSRSGLAYVSYNAQPGWATRRIVRDVLLRARSVREAAPEDRAARAIDVATRLLDDLPSRNYAHAVSLAEELERVRSGEPFYVAHEYLAEVNEGFWLGDFVERARRNGLEYVADAQFCRWEGHMPAELKSAVAKRGLDPVEREQAADLLGNRFFRASILRRVDATETSASQRELLEEAYIASSLSTQSDPFDLSDGVVERFHGPSGTDGPEVTLDAAITKAAVVLLAAQWPRGSRFADLVERAEQLLAAHGSKATNDARGSLVDDLTALFETGQIELRFEEPSISVEIPEHPRAHALARFEADQRDTLTTPFHSSLPFEPAARALVRAADGSRSTEPLEEEHEETLSQRTFAVAARFGLLRES